MMGAKRTNEKKEKASPKSPPIEGTSESVLFLADEL